MFSHTYIQWILSFTLYRDIPSGSEFWDFSEQFLGSMLPQYMALSVSFVSLRLSKKNCVSVRWITLWVRPPPL